MRLISAQLIFPQTERVPGADVLPSMYPSNSEQAVNMRGLAQRLRGQMQESRDPYYCRMFQAAALELEGAADALDRTAWLPPPRPIDRLRVH